ncbi:MAG: OapB/ArvB family protein [Candidatus Hodarchaeales archaeon]|jgi:hypothetical protein
MIDDYEDRLTLFMDYLTKNSGKKMSPEDKCRLVISSVMEGKVMVIEGGLNSNEEALLIEKSMNKIDHERFLGVEIYTNNISTDRSIFKRPEKKVTVIAPACTELSIKTY